MSQITKTAWDLNEKAPNRYQLVYELIELAKKLVDESQMKKPRDDFGFDVEIFYFCEYLYQNLFLTFFVVFCISIFSERIMCYLFMCYYLTCVLVKFMW